MTNYISYFEQRKYSLAISLLYVGIGTIAILSIYPGDFLSRYFGEWWCGGFLHGSLLLLTMPVIVISGAIRFGVDSVLPVFLVQFVMLAITFLLLSKRIKK